MTAAFSGQGLACVRGERLVFSDLDFTLAPGDALVLIGPNGSGKSSLLRLMAGFLPPAAGRMLWGDEPVSDDMDGHRGRLHYVGHLDAIKPVLSVAENLAFWAALRGPGGAACEQAVAGALERFGIGHIAQFPGRFLSAGQRRRLNLARILAAPAPLWLLDEPSVALDRQTVGALERMIAEHRLNGGMVVVSTHAEIVMDGARELHLADFSATLAPGDYEDDEEAEGEDDREEKGRP